jgi:hypothetical protein
MGSYNLPVFSLLTAFLTKRKVFLYHLKLSALGQILFLLVQHKGLQQLCLLKDKLLHKLIIFLKLTSTYILWSCNLVAIFSENFLISSLFRCILDFPPTCGNMKNTRVNLSCVEKLKHHKLTLKSYLHNIRYDVYH